MNKTGRKIDYFKKFVTAVIVSAPMLLQYIVFFDFILAPEYLLFICLIFSVYFSPVVNVELHKWLFVYLFYVFLQTTILLLLTNGVGENIFLTTYLRYLFYFAIVLIVSQPNFDVELGALLVVWFSVANSIYGLMQFFSYSFFGFVLPWSLPFLEVKYGGLLISEHEYFVSNFGFRLSGIFSEPAHFSQYIAFALLVVLFFKSDRFCLSGGTRTAISLLFFGVLLLSGSGTGFFSLLVIFLFLLHQLVFIKKKWGLAIFVFSLFFIGVLGFAFGEIGFSGLARISSFDESSSINVRLIRPFEVFFDMPLSSQLIGVGYGNYANYLVSTGLLNSYELARDVAWTNTAAFILVGSGVFAFLFYVIYHCKLYMRSGFFGRYCIVYIFYHAFFSDLPLSLFAVLIYSFVAKLALFESSRNKVW